MRVLIDECAPKALKHSLVAEGHACLTVQEAGWSGKQNGELLALAEAEFDALVTLDTNLRCQQNLKDQRLAVVIILARSNRLNDLSPHFPACAQALRGIKPGEVLCVGSTP